MDGKADAVHRNAVARARQLTEIAGETPSPRVPDARPVRRAIRPDDREALPDKS